MVKNETKLLPWKMSWACHRAKLLFRIQISVTKISFIDWYGHRTFYPPYTNYKGFLGCQWSVQEAVFAVKLLNHTGETQRIYVKHLNLPAMLKAGVTFKEQKLCL